MSDSRRKLPTGDLPNGFHIAAHEVVPGDQIVYENQIWEVGSVDPASRFYDGTNPAITPVFHLWEPGKVPDISSTSVQGLNYSLEYQMNSYAEKGGKILRPMCIDTPIRLWKANHG